MKECSHWPRCAPPAWLVVAASMLLATSIATASAPQAQTTAQPAAKPKAGESPQDETTFARIGEQTTKRVCAECHALDTVTQARRAAREWKDEVEAMVGRGASGTDDEIATIRKYLTRYYGLVRVNAAPAEELSAVLGLSARDAAAIVEYRKANGNFPDLASLKKVEGIDQTKLEDQPDAIIFK